MWVLGTFQRDVGTPSEREPEPRGCEVLFEKTSEKKGGEPVS